jgi:hypothetical protein
MNLRTMGIAATTTMLALVCAAAAQPAYARWTFHDESLGERITAPPGGTRAQTCAGRLEATSAGASPAEDPATFEIPAHLRTAVSYEVWKAPAGFDSFASATRDSATEPIFLEDPDQPGIRHQATLVGRLTTPPRAPLATPEPSGGNPNFESSWIFTTAPISVRLTGVAPGDTLGLVLAGAAAGFFVDVTAMDCGLPVLNDRIDVRPGSRSNTVQPTNTAARVAVRVFGSRRLDVRRITTIHLGEAAPASGQPPRDVDRDGRLDRLYVFQQAMTDILCIDTAVKVTGLTANHKRFQGRSRITTAGCDG